jgi:hypothetical protein
MNLPGDKLRRPRIGHTPFREATLRQWLPGYHLEIGMAVVTPQGEEKTIELIARTFEDLGEIGAGEHQGSSEPAGFVPTPALRHDAGYTFFGRARIEPACAYIQQ